MEEYYTIHTPDYYNNIFIELHNLQKQGVLCDVTLIAEDGEVMAHKVVLMAVSKYFRDKLSPTMGTNPTKICLKGISVCELANLIQYIYSGKLLVSRDSMDVILEISEILGLTGVVDAYNDIIMYEEVKRQKGMCIPCKTFTCHSASNVEPTTSSQGADVVQGGKSTTVATSESAKPSVADVNVEVTATQSNVDKNTTLVQADITGTSDKVIEGTSHSTASEGNTAAMVSKATTCKATTGTDTTGEVTGSTTSSQPIIESSSQSIATIDNTTVTSEVTISTCQSTDHAGGVADGASQPTTAADYNFSALYDQQYMDVTVGSNSPLKRSPACGSKRPVMPSVSDVGRNIAEEEAQHQDLLTVAIETLSDASYLKHQSQPELDKAVMSISNRDKAVMSISNRDKAVMSISNRDKAVMSISNRGKADLVVPLDEPMAENTVEPFVNGKTNTKTFTLSAGTVNNELGGKTDVYTVSLDPLSVKKPLVMPRPKRSKSQKEKDAEEKARMWRQRKAQILENDLKRMIAAKKAADGNESKQRKTRSSTHQDFQYESLSKTKKKACIPRVVRCAVGAGSEEVEYELKAEAQVNKELTDDSVQVDFDSEDDGNVDVEDFDDVNGMIANDIVGVMTDALDSESNTQAKGIAVITGDKNSRQYKDRVDARKKPTSITAKSGSAETDTTADIVEATDSVDAHAADRFTDHSEVTMSPMSQSDDETSEKLRSSSLKRKTRTPKKILCTDSENSDCRKDAQDKIPVVRLRKRSYCLDEVNDTSEMKIPKSESVSNFDDTDSDSGVASSVQLRVSKSLMPNVRLKKHSAEEILQMAKELRDKKLYNSNTDVCETVDCDKTTQSDLQTNASSTTDNEGHNVLRRILSDDLRGSKRKCTPTGYIILDKDDVLNKGIDPDVRNRPKTKSTKNGSSDDEQCDIVPPTYVDGVQVYACPDKNCLFTTKYLATLKHHRFNYHRIYVEEEVVTSFREDPQDGGQVPWQSVEMDLDTDEIRCPKCPKTFKTPGLMKKHYFASHSENKFKCSHCDYVARVKSNLNVHMKLKHSLSENGVNKCQFCSYATVVLGNLKNHMLHAHQLIMITNHVRNSSEKFYDFNEGDIATIDGKLFDPKTMPLPKQQPRASNRRFTDRQTNTPDGKTPLFKLPVNEFVQEVMKRHEFFLKQPQKNYSYMCNSIAKATEQPSFPQASPQIRNNHVNKLYNMQKMKLPVVIDEHNGYVAGQLGVPGVDNEVVVAQHEYPEVTKHPEVANLEYPEVVVENVESGESKNVLTITEHKTGKNGEDLIVINQKGKQTVVRYQDFYDTLSTSGNDSNQTLEVIAALLQAGEQIEIREQGEQEDYVEIQNA